MPDKYICIRQCYQRNPSNQWKLFDVNETEWWERDPGKHWAKLPAGEAKTAEDIMREKCRGLGIEVDMKWDLSRLQREYDVKFAEQDKKIRGERLRETDARVTNDPPEKYKRK